MKRIALTLSARSTAVLIVGAVVLAAVVLIAVARPSTTSADCAAGGFCLDLTPSSAARPVVASHTVSAALTTSSGSGVGGFTVTFSIATGPNAGGSGSCTPSDCKTDPAGNVSFTYTSNGTEGTDTIQACATDGVIKIAQQAACGPGQVGATATVAWLETTLTVTKVITND